MIRIYIKLAIATCLLATANSARSHHSFNAVYDKDRVITVEGVVKEFRLTNPHTFMMLDAVDDQGKPVTWRVEFDGLLNLTVAGWDAQTIPVGARVKVTGNAAWDQSPSLWFASLVFDDGRELVRPFDARIDTIDAERRRRAQERASQQAPQ